ncbi:hypothetical protein XANCAGTX0491_000486 [Xanthoria calcicola]
MVVTVGLCKAVKLRHVGSKFPSVASAPSLLNRAGEAFDAGVQRKRAIFHKRSPVTVMKLWLTDTPTPTYEELRRGYVPYLCGVIAHNFSHALPRFLATMSQTDNSSSVAVDDLLSAAAAVEELHKVRYYWSMKQTLTPRETTKAPLPSEERPVGNGKVSSSQRVSPSWRLVTGTVHMKQLRNGFTRRLQSDIWSGWASMTMGVGSFKTLPFFERGCRVSSISSIIWWISGLGNTIQPRPSERPSSRAAVFRSHCQVLQSREDTRLKLS